MWNFRAVKLRVWRIWTVDEAGGFMGISFSSRVPSVGGRILLRRVLRGDLRCDYGTTSALLLRSLSCAGGIRG